MTRWMLAQNIVLRGLNGVEILMCSASKWLDRHRLL